MSIILPTYNRASLIGETIESVVAQTYKNWELIIVDDGSDDSTESVVQAFADKRITYHKLSHSGFIGKVRNYGIKNSNGELIAFHDSDDLWRADKLVIQINLLSKYPEAFFVLSNGDKFGDGSIPTPDYENVFFGNLFLPILQYERFPFYSPTFLFKKTVMEQTDLLDESVPSSRDIEFFFRVSRNFSGVFTNERLVKIRKHSKNTSEKFNTASYYNNLRVLDSFLQRKLISKRTFSAVASRYHYKLGLQQLNAHPKEALRQFFSCAKIRPSYLKAYARFAQSLLGTVVKRKNLHHAG